MNSSTISAIFFSLSRRIPDEDVSTIIKVLKHDEIESELLEAFLKRQSAILPSLDDIPQRLHTSIFRLQRIEASWDNCLTFINSETFNAETLTAFLAQEDIQAVLSSIVIDNDKSKYPLRNFLINNNDLEVDVYRTYIRTLPKPFVQFPNDIDPEKLLVLIEEKKVTFSQSTFQHLTDHYDYQVLFVALNIEAYLESKEKFALDDDFREQLLNSDIPDEQKLKLVADMDLSLLSTLSTRASLIGDLFYRTNANISALSAEAAQEIIKHTAPVAMQVSLLNRCHKVLSDEQVRQTLQDMPDPFPEFKPGWKQPTIPNTEDNIELVEWLVERGFISSWRETFFGDIRVYNFRK